MTEQLQIWYGLIRKQAKKASPCHRGMLCVCFKGSATTTIACNTYYPSICRGAGYTFGGEVVRRFLSVNGMEHILRAHQICMEVRHVMESHHTPSHMTRRSLSLVPQPEQGYQILFDDQLSTVWSAPNYCYRCGNMASVLEVDAANRRTFNVFGPAPENEREVRGGSGATDEQDVSPQYQYFL